MKNERLVCSDRHWNRFCKFEDRFSPWTCVHSCLTCVRVRKECSVGKTLPVWTHTHTHMRPLTRKGKLMITPTSFCVGGQSKVRHLNNYVMYGSREAKSPISPQKKKDSTLIFLLNVFHNDSNQVASKSQFWKNCHLCPFSHDAAQVDFTLDDPIPPPPPTHTHCFFLRLPIQRQIIYSLFTVHSFQSEVVRTHEDDRTGRFWTAESQLSVFLFVKINFLFISWRRWVARCLDS